MQGREIGPWRIEERLGAGGMGVVYRADRADGLYERTVALKLLAPDPLLSSGEELARRLAAERQILARLEHDGIARLYDGGVTEDGLSWLALELVDGEPITRYAERRSLDSAARVALFARACEAVAYAHRNLVVHRDLKPDHILIVEGETGTGVKLLDFGVSALLRDPTGDGLTLPTVAHALTPSYAAPEQVRGEPVTTASDIYALGAVLYELLAGQRPYDLSGQTAAGIERTIAEVEPPPPSAVAPPERARALRGDLDTVVMKALAKEPDRRYATAEALAEDLRRHLDGLPVEARPATVSYRASRFVRRHRLGVASTAAFVLLAVVLVGVYTARLAAERDRTAQALDRSEQTLAFLEEVIAAGGAEEGDPDTPIGVVLDSAAVQAAGLDANVPEVAREIHLTLGNVFREIGRAEAAEQEARRALALFPSDETVRGSSYGLGLSLLAMARKDQDDVDGALAYHEQALAYFPAPRSPAAAPESARLRASALSAYADALAFVSTRLDEAEAAYRESIVLYRTLGDPDVVNPLSGLAVMLNPAGRQEEAVPILREIVDAMRAEFDRPHYRLGIALSNLGSTLNELGRYDEARPALREAIDVADQTVGRTHPTAVISRATYALHLRASGRLDEAVQVGEEAVSDALAAFGPDHSLTAFAQNVAGSALCDGGDPERGARMLRASTETRRATLPEGHWLVYNGESLLGGCLARLGRTREAERLLTSSYAALGERLAADHVRLIEARERLRLFYEAEGRTAEAQGLGAGSGARSQDG